MQYFQIFQLGIVQRKIFQSIDYFSKQTLSGPQWLFSQTCTPLFPSLSFPKPKYLDFAGLNNILSFQSFQHNSECKNHFKLEKKFEIYWVIGENELWLRIIYKSNIYFTHQKTKSFVSTASHVFSDKITFSQPFLSKRESLEQIFFLWGLPPRAAKIEINKNTSTLQTKLFV